MIRKIQIEEAHLKIAPYIHRTPVLTNTYLNNLSGSNLYFKCENFQKIGAFKARGAINAALNLLPEQIKNGICTHSSGNHAQAIAYAAKILGTKAYIVMPNNAPSVKINAVKDYGAHIVFCEPTLAARETSVEKIISEKKAYFIHPFNNQDVIIGQASCAKELIEDQPALQALVAPVGGGGLFAGTCLSTHFFSEGAQAIGAEPEGAADAVLSFKSGKVEQAPYINTIADGLLTGLGDLNLSIIRQYATDIQLVSESEIKQALRLVYERLKIVVEPSCVVPLAAVLKYKSTFAGKQVGIILTGGNIDLGKMSSYLS